MEFSLPLWATVPVLDKIDDTHIFLLFLGFLMLQSVSIALQPFSVCMTHKLVGPSSLLFH